MLDAPGIRVLGVAESADRAARLLARRKPHVLLIWSCAAAEDAALDAITGAKATSSRTSVILVMPSLGAFDVTRALKLGCSGYLQPTVGRGALRRAVRAVARGECIVEPSALKDLLNALARTRDRAQPEGQDSLAASEREMLRLITEGMTNRDIAAKLGYRLGTVKEYVQRIIEKLGVSDRTQAAAKAVRLGLVE
jgi:DNA-binding NarL/FixJ family response regulator